MKISLPTSKRKARIEIIPLIDVVFFLLATFVMVSLSMVKNLGVQVNLPVATTSAPEERDQSVTITITKAGEVFLNKEAISLSALKERLSSLKASDPKLKVFINGDEEADFGLAIKVLDEVRLLGITKVAIQTKGKS